MPVITNIEDLKRLYRRRVPKMFFDYAESGSWSEQTFRDNVKDFSDIRLRQRVAIDMSGRHTRSEMIGEPVSMPVALAPVGVQAPLVAVPHLVAVAALQHQNAVGPYAESAGVVVVVALAERSLQLSFGLGSRGAVGFAVIRVFCFLCRCCCRCCCCSFGGRLRQLAGERALRALRAAAALVHLRPGPLPAAAFRRLRWPDVEGDLGALGPDDHRRAGQRPDLDRLEGSQGTA